jgi:purine-binding chemotaxis protein CheW
MRSEPGTMRACADAAVPVRRWQRVQWQYEANCGASLTSKRTPPHRQPPVSGKSVTPRSLRTENAPVAAAGTRQLVVFSLGREEYALPIESVQEVIRWSEPRSIGAAEPWLLGVVSVRGAIVPVCDLALRLRRDGARPRDPKIVLVEVKAGRAGLVVDEVAEVLTVAAERIGAVPGAGDDALAGIAELDGRLILVLDAERVLAGVELAAKPKRAGRRTRST